MNGDVRFHLRTQWMVLPLVLVLAMVTAGAGRAAWSPSGNGIAAGAALVMGSGTTPAATAGGTGIAVSWTAVTLPGGAAVDGYIVKRYDANTGAPQTVGAGCSGVVTSTRCLEQNVPSGSWLYTDTPVFAYWTGQESLPSSAVTVP
jgi:hypothetical protein